MIPNDYTAPGPWWQETSDEKKLIRAWATYRAVADQERARLATDLWHSRMYANQRDIRPTTQGSLFNFNGAMMTLNGIKAVSDTIVARVARSRPLPVFQTDGGDFSLMRRAKRLSAFTEAQFRISEVDSEVPRVAHDAVINGTGCLHVYREGKDIYVERVNPMFVFVDQAECTEGNKRGMRTLYRRRWVNRNHFASQFPKTTKKHLAALRSASPGDESHLLPAKGNKEDLVEVIEAWRLPGQDGKGGEHIIFTDKMIVLKEDWNHDRFPILFLHYGYTQFGHWANGVVQNLKPLQVELNYNIRKAQQIMKIYSTARVFLPSTSGINKDQFQSGRNIDWQVYPYVASGGQPTIYAPNSVPPEIFAHIQDTYRKMFELEGVPQLADGKPSGLISGVAIREFEDLQQGRFALFSRRYEKMHTDIAQWMVEYGREIAEEYGDDWAVPQARDKYTIETVKWSKVDMERDQYIISVLPASSLPTSFGGRKDYVVEMIQAGLIDAKTGKRLLDFPDLDAHVAIEQAAEDHADWAIEQLLEGEAVDPEPFHDNQLLIKRCQAHYNRLSTQNVPDDIMSNIRVFIQKAVENVQKSMMRQQAELPGGGPQPPAVGFGGQPPTSAQDPNSQLI